MRLSTLIQTGLWALALSAALLAQQTEPEVRSRIEGKVLRASNGEPLTGVELILRREGSGSLQFGTTTGADGRFVLRDIPKGRYLLSAAKRGFLNQEYGQKKPGRPGAILDLTTGQTMRDVSILMTAGGVI